MTSAITAPDDTLADIGRQHRRIDVHMYFFTPLIIDRLIAKLLGMDIDMNGQALRNSQPNNIRRQHQRTVLSNRAMCGGNQRIIRNLCEHGTGGVLALAGRPDKNGTEADRSALEKMATAAQRGRVLEAVRINVLTTKAPLARTAADTASYRAASIGPLR